MAVNVVKSSRPVNLGSFSSDPSAADNGTMYYNTTLGLLRVKENGVWVDYTSSTVFIAYQTLIANQMRSVAYIKDIKTNGTAGGTFTNGRQTRVLNTLEDPMGIVTSLSSNQFVLPAGRYAIEMLEEEIILKCILVFNLEQ